MATQNKLMNFIIRKNNIVIYIVTIKYVDKSVIVYVKNFFGFLYLYVFNDYTIN